MLTPNEYQYLYGNISLEKLSPDIVDAIMCGDDLTEEQQAQVKKIIIQEANGKII